jgi:hypothetical protein
MMTHSALISDSSAGKKGVATVAVQYLVVATSRGGRLLVRGEEGVTLAIIL